MISTETDVAWDDDSNALFISIREAGISGQIVIYGWQSPIHWSTNWSGTTEIMPDHMSPDLPVLDETVTWAEPWRRTIPIVVRQAINPFLDGHWLMLHLASRSAPALELLCSAPNLFWVLVITATRNQWPCSEILRHVTLKRRHILDQCGFHPADATLKVLQKMQFRRWGQRTYDWLTVWLGDPSRVKALSHYDKITPPQLWFLDGCFDMAQSSLVRNAPNDRRYFLELKDRLTRTRNLAMQAEGDYIREGLLRRRYIDELNNMERRLELGVEPRTNSQNRLIGSHYESMTDIGHHDGSLDHYYPEPPIPRTKTISPIKSLSLLQFEGRARKNCAANYHDRIMKGDYYIYRVYEPIRCTLGMIIKKDMLVIEQIRAYDNSRVDAEICQAIYDTLVASTDGARIILLKQELTSPGPVAM